MHFVFSLTHHLIKRQGKKARKKVIALLRASQNPYININLGSLAPLHGLLSNSLIFGPISSDLLPFQSSLYIDAIDQKSKNPTGYSCYFYFTQKTTTSKYVIGWTGNFLRKCNFGPIVQIEESRQQQKLTREMLSLHSLTIYTTLIKHRCMTIVAEKSVPFDLRMLRSFRCLRPLKMVSKVPSKLVFARQRDELCCLAFLISHLLLLPSASSFGVYYISISEWFLMTRKPVIQRHTSWQS